MANLVRGNVYKFEDGKTDKEKYAVVMGADYRSKDKLVSIVMLGDSEFGHDVVPVIVNDNTFYAHCGLLTYCPSAYLVSEVDKVSKDTMQKLERSILRELGLSDYEKMYSNIIERLKEGN